MTYIELINRFWKIHSISQFTNAEIALYMFLTAECNAFQWPESFPLATKEIEYRLGLHRNSVISARKKLEENGLIKVSVKKGSVHNFYSICDAYRQKKDKKKGKMDSINQIAIRDELAQTLCKSWCVGNEKTSREIASQLTQLLCSLKYGVAQQLAQQLAQFLCNYTLYNGNTVVLPKDIRLKTTPLPPKGEREKYDEFLAWYFSDERRGSIDPLCKSFGVRYTEFRRLAESAIDEICGTGDPFTDNFTVARKMQNLVRAKARFETNTPSATKPGPNPHGIPLGPGEWFDVNGRRRYDDSPVVVPLVAIPRPSIRHHWDEQGNKWTL